MNTDTIDQRPEHTVLGVTRETELVWEGHMAEDTGATGGPLPCAKMTANQSEICIRGTRGEFHVPRTAIQRISKGKLYPWLFQAVQVHHTLPRCSRELQFKPTAVKLTEVFERLRALGYPVK